MIILPEYQAPYIINDFNSPILPRHFWIYSASLFDFTLAPLSFIEESESTIVNLEIDGFELSLPYKWFIIITDPYTNDLDCIEVQHCAAIYSHALIVSMNDSKIRNAPINVKNLKKKQNSYYPLLQKNCGLCYPISKEKDRRGLDTHLSIVVSPYDLSKSIINKCVGDLLN